MYIGLYSAAFSFPYDIMNIDIGRDEIEYIRCKVINFGRLVRSQSKIVLGRWGNLGPMRQARRSSCSVGCTTDGLQARFGLSSEIGLLVGVTLTYASTNKLDSCTCRPPCRADWRCMTDT
jgi:hypothetical protein